MKHLLITGGCGFIGSNFIRHLLSTATNVIVYNLDKLTYAGNTANLKEFEKNPNYHFIKGDICDEHLVNSVISKIDTVIHFAAESHVDRSIHSSEDFINTNVVGTRVLLDAAMQRGRVEKFIHFSTDEVYGVIERGSFLEDSPFRPTSPYAASKAAADLLVQSYQKTHRFPAIILRGSNNFGPYQFPEKVIPLFITNLIEVKKLPLYSRGENSREWIFVDDTCRAISVILEKGRIGEVYNVGSGFEISNYELAKMILSEFRRDESEINYVPDRPAHDLRYKLNSDKLKELGFKAELPFSKRLSETVQWYKAHSEWWKSLKKDQFTCK